MDRRHFVKTATVLSAWSFIAPACLRKQKSLPNILFIYADDMGYGGVQALNPDSKIPTPT